MLGAVTRAVRWVGVVVPAALLTVDVLLIAMMVFLVVSSLVGDAADDPHGYSLIFGAMGLLVFVPIGLVVVTLLRRLAG